jgi:phage terminase large subunit GpA-like protein
MGLFQLPAIEELLTDIRRIDVDKMARQYSRVVCPLGCLIGPEHKERMNQSGIWLPEGLKLDSQDRKVGEARTSNIASYWLGGVAATYITWENLIRKDLQAIHEYVMTGNELPWQATVNTDQGMPYLSRALSAAKGTSRPEDRQDPTFIRRIVPRWARFLIATVDVQGGLNARFVVQVHAYGEGMEMVPVDRFSIVDSKRSAGEGRWHPVDPASNAEDWDVLTDRVINSTYPIEGTADQELQVHLTVVDTGGEQKKKQIGETQAAGTTEKAYAWWRRLRREGKDRKVMLVKGAPTKEADWFIREVQAGGKSGRGDVPLHLLNSNLIKGMVTSSINRKERGPNYYHFPGWLTKPWFEELTAEIRNADGSYTQIRARNEAFDLSAYGTAGCIKLKVDGKNFWISPPRCRPMSALPPWMTRPRRRPGRARSRSHSVGVRSLRTEIGVR